LKGKIKRLIRLWGFGFITTENGEEVLFHRSALQGEDFDVLDEGAERSPGSECKDSEIRSVPQMSLKQKEKGKGLLGALSAKE
jgi:cold shock CspA family protein